MCFCGLLSIKNSQLLKFKCNTLRGLKIPSNREYINNKKEKSLSQEPKDLIRCMLKYVSKYSPYRRGIPFNPIKWWGIKVKFTPKNKDQKVIFIIKLFKVTPMIKGYHMFKPIIIPKTAPIEST